MVIFQLNLEKTEKRKRPKFLCVAARICWNFLQVQRPHIAHTVSCYWFKFFKHPILKEPAASANSPFSVANSSKNSFWKNNGNGILKSKRCPQIRRFLQSEGTNRLDDNYWIIIKWLDSQWRTNKKLSFELSNGKNPRKVMNRI